MLYISFIKITLVSEITVVQNLISDGKQILIDLEYYCIHPIEHSECLGKWKKGGGYLSLF